MSARFLQYFTHPLHVRSDVQRSLEGFLKTYLKDDALVYDIGCGDKPFTQFFASRSQTYLGVDIEDGFYDADKIDIIGSAYDVPTEPQSVDAIIFSQVLEHLEKPWEALREASRILKDDGYMFMSSPFLYPVHAEPHDFGRYTIFYIEKKLAEHGLKIVECKEIGGFWYLVGTFLGMYLSMFNKGPIKKTRILDVLIWLVKSFVTIFHALETFLLRSFGKSGVQKKWVVNYVMVVQKG